MTAAVARAEGVPTPGPAGNAELLRRKSAGVLISRRALSLQGGHRRPPRVAQTSGAPGQINEQICDPLDLPAAGVAYTA